MWRRASTAVASNMSTLTACVRLWVWIKSFPSVSCYMSHISVCAKRLMMLLFFLMHNQIEHITNFQVNIFLKFRLTWNSHHMLITTHPLHTTKSNHRHINCVITLCVIKKNFVEKMKKGRFSPSWWAIKTWWVKPVKSGTLLLATEEYYWRSQWAPLGP